MPTHAGQALAHVYAEALYDAAKDADALERTEQELLALQEILNKDVRLRRFVDTPAVPPQVKRKVIIGVLKDFAPTTLNFLSVLIRKQRVGLLDAIVDAFHEHCNRKGGFAELTLETAVPADTEAVEKLKATLKAKLGRTILLKTRQRPELLGGFVLKHEDKQWDASLLSRLSRAVDQMEALKGSLGAWKD